MNPEQMRLLVTRFWEAEAARRSARRAERMRVMAWDGDLYRIEEEVEEVMLDVDSRDQFVLAAVQHPARPHEDWVVAWLAGPIEDAIRHGDERILQRLTKKGMDGALAKHIEEFIG